MLLRSDGNICNGSVDDTMKVWDIKTGYLIQSVEGHSSDVNALDFFGQLKYLQSVL